MILRQGTSEGVSIEATAQALKQIETDVHGRNADHHTDRPASLVGLDLGWRQDPFAAHHDQFHQPRADRGGRVGQVCGGRAESRRPARGVRRRLHAEHRRSAGVATAARRRGSGQGRTRGQRRRRSLSTCPARAPIRPAGWSAKPRYCRSAARARRSSTRPRRSRSRSRGQAWFSTSAIPKSNRKSAAWARSAREAPRRAGWPFASWVSAATSPRSRRGV